MNEKNLFCYIMVAPALVVTLLLGIYPMLTSMFISFRSYDLLNVQERGSHWVGLRNYFTVFADERFVQTVMQTILFTVLAVAISVVMGLFLAQVINVKFRGLSVVRTLILVPWFVPPAVASVIWIWLLNTDLSPINALLRDVGWIDANIRFMTDSRTWGPISIPMMAIVAVRVWNGLPFIIIFILAGLQSVPKDYYEAAEIDGANIVQKFFYVTLPTLKPVLLILLALLFMGGIGHFEMNFIMTGGGPRNLTNVMAVYAYNQGFLFFKFDVAAAASGVILMMTSVICVFYLWAQSRDDLR
ncbi:MAG: sugar ABC transporter permease [Rhodobacteraceae bacterium]|nr:sugar ABC transporter permease [Paracoccaceae bacterium]MCY4138670.1 sugar ABC transporter permease [Paracoccaceae bacterium]